VDTTSTSAIQRITFHAALPSHSPMTRPVIATPTKFLKKHHPRTVSERVARFELREWRRALCHLAWIFPWSTLLPNLLWYPPCLLFGLKFLFWAKPWFKWRHVLGYKGNWGPVTRTHSRTELLEKTQRKCLCHRSRLFAATKKPSQDITRIS